VGVRNSTRSLTRSKRDANNHGPRRETLQRVDLLHRPRDGAVAATHDDTDVGAPQKGTHHAAWGVVVAQAANLADMSAACIPCELHGSISGINNIHNSDHPPEVGAADDETTR
jgi:hypothetical protein